MSAERYDTCPICTNKVQKLNKELEESYGKIPYDEWYQKKQEIQPGLESETLAMWYELYIQGNYLVIDVGLACRECNFGFKFKHKEPLLKENKK